MKTLVPNPRLKEWSRTDYPTIMSGLVVRYTWTVQPYDNKPEVSASREYVCLNGAWPTMSLDDVLLVRLLMGMAAQQASCIRQTGNPVETVARARESFGIALGRLKNAALAEELSDDCTDLETVETELFERYLDAVRREAGAA